MSTPSGDGRHIPVMLAEVLAALEPRDGERYIDATFGAGGYTKAILGAAETHVLAIDRDPDAIAEGQALVAASGGRLMLLQGVFGDMASLATGSGFAAVDGIVLDIGVSSMQLDRAERGFSFMSDGPLDMRMSQEGRSAADIVNEDDERDIAFILRTWGEERQAGRIARAITREREKAPIATTRQLAAIVERVLGRSWDERKHPATRTFQALRIAVNNELDELTQGLEAAERLLKPGGRLVLVTFHSEEDRIAKRFLTERTGRTSGVSRHGPPMTGEAPSQSFRFVNHRPLTPGEEEIARNPRSRSAKLRTALRTEAAPFPASRERDRAQPPGPDRRRR